MHGTPLSVSPVLAGARPQNLRPAAGIGTLPIVPCDGVRATTAAPRGGAIQKPSQGTPIPSPGHHLDMPSDAANQARH